MWRVGESRLGGATNGHHVLLYDDASGCNDRVLTPARATPKTLRHLVGSAVQGRFRPSPAPPSDGLPRRALRWKGKFLWQGLLDMSDPSANYICPSVFSRTGFVERQLTAAEIMTALDLPSRHHKGRRELPPDIIWGLPSAIVTSVLMSLWGNNGGGSGKPERWLAESTGRPRGGTAPKTPSSWVDGPAHGGSQKSKAKLSEGVEKSISSSCLDSVERTSECSGGERIDGEEALVDGRVYAAVEPAALMAHRGSLLPSHPLVCPAEKSPAHAAVSAAPTSQHPATGGVGACDESRAESRDDLLDTAAGGVGVGENSPVKSEDTPSCPSRAKTNMGDQLVDDEAARGEYTNDFDMSNTPSGDVLRGIADERNNLRAVKSDKAEVKKEWWDEQVFGKAPSEEEASAADALRKSLLLRWSRNVMEDCSEYMRDK